MAANKIGPEVYREIISKITWGPYRELHVCLTSAVTENDEKLGPFIELADHVMINPELNLWEYKQGVMLPDRLVHELQDAIDKVAKKVKRGD